MRSSGEVFDKARFLASLDGNVEAFREIAGLFVGDCPRRLTALHNALASCDWAALESAAHMLKGSAGYIGAANVFAAAEEVETLTRCGNISRIHQACAKLHRETAHLLKVLATAVR